MSDLEDSQQDIFLSVSPQRPQLDADSQKDLFASSGWSTPDSEKTTQPPDSVYITISSESDIEDLPVSCMSKYSMFR